MSQAPEPRSRISARSELPRLAFLWRVRAVAIDRPQHVKIVGPLQPWHHLEPAPKRNMISRQYVSEIRLKREEVESFDRYPFSLAAVRPLERLELHPAVTFFIGENGSGKSTLLEAIAVACGFNAEGGSRNFRFGTRPSHSELHRFLRVAKGFPRPLDGFFF